MEPLKELRELDLDDSAIKVYLACLRGSGVNVKEISKQTSLIRTTVYGILKTLMQRGLVSTLDKDGVMIFRAAPPKELLNTLDQKRAKIESMIPLLERYQSFIPVPSHVEFFEGQGGVKTITDDIISKPDEIVKVLSAGQKWLEFSGIFTSIYYRKKKEMNVHTKTILANTSEERKFLSSNKFSNSDIRVINGVDFGKTATYIYQDKVSFVVYDSDEPRGFIVQDKEFNRIQNMLFDKLWSESKKLKN